jgi:hypothetical protein
MREWEYRKLDLNDVPRKGNDIDVLCDAGREGWELVSIGLNNFAYLKREIERQHPRKGRGKPAKS